jgi:predicted XRE-type DNA-binding protein
MGKVRREFWLDPRLLAEAQSVLGTATEHETVELVAIKRVLAFQMQALMKEQKLTQAEMAARMSTSRSSLKRLLDPSNPSVTLQTLQRAAAVLGKRLRIELT